MDGNNTYDILLTGWKLYCAGSRPNSEQHAVSTWVDWLKFIVLHVPDIRLADVKWVGEDCVINGVWVFIYEEHSAED